MTSIEQAIVNIVESRQGLKATELIVELISQDSRILDKSYFDAIDNLIKRGDILEVEYRLLSLPDRVKSFYLPKATFVRLRQI